jgi:hypothetical protein
MFNIYDGRGFFYQWDLNRKLVISDPSITEVHFCNRTEDCALVCEVYKENGLNLVNVPNVLLQKSFCINVFAYDGESTKHSATFKVKPKSRPADYVYTETEVKSWVDLDKKIIELEKNGKGFKEVDKPDIWLLDTGAYKVTNGFYLGHIIPELPGGDLEKEFINTIAGCYLFIFSSNLPHIEKRHYYAITPIAVLYGDITLQEMEDEITNETYTIAQGTLNRQTVTKKITDSATNDEIPTAAAVFNYVNSQLSGGGNINKVFEKIATVTVTADESGNLPSKILITKDNNGNAFELTDIYCDMSIGLADGVNGKMIIKAGEEYLIGNLNAYFTNALRKWFFRYDSYGEGLGGLCIAPSSSMSGAGVFPNSQISGVMGQPVPVGKTVIIDSLEFSINTGTAKTFIEGTTITLWGVRK